MVNNQKLVITFTSIIILGSCTLNEGDSQITMCQKITANLINAEGVEWKETNKNPNSDKSMNVSIHWDSQDANGTLPMQASCLYRANEDDDSENFDPDFDDEYESVPANITINGQPIRSQDLYTAIYKVTGQSIKDTVNEEHLRKKAAEANQAIRAGAAQVKEKAGVAAKALKEGSKQLKQKAGEVLQKAGDKLQK